MKDCRRFLYDKSRPRQAESVISHNDFDMYSSAESTGSREQIKRCKGTKRQHQVTIPDKPSVGLKLNRNRSRRHSCHDFEIAALLGLKG